MSIPEPLRTEHETLRRHLADIIALGGRTGAAAKEVASLLRPHLRAEEDLVFPALGSLAELAAGRPAPNPTVLIQLAERLKAELPRMALERTAIVRAIDRLASAAKEEGRSESAQFAERLELHARTEEVVLYSAAVLVGDYLRTVCGQGLIQARWPERMG